MAHPISSFRITLTCLALILLSSVKSAANPCADVLNRYTYAPGHNVIWNLAADGKVTFSTDEIFSFSYEPLTDGRRGYRVTEKFRSFQFPQLRIGEIVLDSQNRVNYVRSYSAYTSFPENPNDPTDNSNWGLRYKFTYTAQGTCLPVYVGGGSVWPGYYQPLFDGNICPKVTATYSELMRTRTVAEDKRKGLTSYVYIYDLLEQLGAILDAEGVAPTFRIDFELGNLKSYLRMYRPDDEPIFDSALVIRAGRLLNYCRINNASPRL